MNKNITSECYIKRTLALMRAFHIPIRNTFDENGPLDLAIEVTESNAAYFDRGEIIDPGNESDAIAYLGPKLLIPKRLLNVKREDVIVHECVHFLQHVSMPDLRGYKSLPDDMGINNVS